MYRKTFIALTVLALLMTVCVPCAFAEEFPQVELSVTEFTFPLNILKPEGSSVPAFSVEKTDDAWILTTDFVPVYHTDTGFEENQITLRDQKKAKREYESEAPDDIKAQLAGELFFVPDGDLWSTRNMKSGTWNGNESVSFDQIELQFDPEHIDRASFQSSVFDNDTELTRESKITVQGNSDFNPMFIVTVTDSVLFTWTTISQIERTAYYDEETGDLFGSSIREQSMSGSKSYSYDGYGKLDAFSAFDRETYESVTIRYDREFDAWMNNNTFETVDPEEIALKLGIDLNKEAPVKIG